MYLCEKCEEYQGTSFMQVLGDSRCPKHGLSSFDMDPLKIYCCSCAEKAQRCQRCACYVNEREYFERQAKIYETNNSGHKWPITWEEHKKGKE